MESHAQPCYAARSVLMNMLLLVITIVALMLPVPTLLVASPVPVTRDTLEMGSHVWVSIYSPLLCCCQDLHRTLLRFMAIVCFQGQRSLSLTATLSMLINHMCGWYLKYVQPHPLGLGAYNSTSAWLITIT